MSSYLGMLRISSEKETSGISIYRQIVQKHLGLQRDYSTDPGSIRLREIKGFITDTCGKGANIKDVLERDQVRKMLRYWAAVVYEMTCGKEYPDYILAAAKFEDRAPLLYAMDEIKKKRLSKKTKPPPKAKEPEVDLAIGAQMCCNFVKRLDISGLDRSVQDILNQALGACEVGVADRMLQLVESARVVAWKHIDLASMAATQFYMGMAHAQKNQFRKAVDCCRRAKLFYHQKQPYNEGAVTYSLGLIYQQYGDSSKSKDYCQESLELFEAVKKSFAAAGQEQKFRDIQAVCNELERIVKLECKIS